MQRLARTIGCTLAVALAATVLSTGAAFAATTGPTRGPAPVITEHGLGARAPAANVLAIPAARATANLALAVLPKSVDLRKWAVTPGNQGALNSCVPWTVDYAMLGWYSRFSGLAGQPFAPMYTYSQINGGGDYGSAATDALQLAVTQGSDTRAHYTQGDSNWALPPTTAERANAAHFKIKGYTTIFIGTNQPATATRLQQALATNHPVAIEMAVRAGFDYLGAGAAAVDNDATSAIRGYHEVLAVGYDAAGLIVQNSWGTGWANGGFGRISWRVVQSDVGEGQTAAGFVQAATPPTVSVPAAHRIGAKPTGAFVRYAASWKGAIGNSGAITRYDAWYQVDGHAFVIVKLGTARATSLVITTRIGHRYRIAVRATAVGKVGAVRYGAVFVA